MSLEKIKEGIVKRDRAKLAATGASGEELAAFDENNRAKLPSEELKARRAKQLARFGRLDEKWNAPELSALQELAGNVAEVPEPDKRTSLEKITDGLERLAEAPEPSESDNAVEDDWAQALDDAARTEKAKQIDPKTGAEPAVSKISRGLAERG